MTIHDIYRRISPSFRSQRMAKFLALFGPEPATKMVDLGGYPWVWAQTGAQFPVLSVNIHVPAGVERYAPQFSMVQGDATRLDFPDRSFDITYSNSVIEHLGTWERQQAFASEARRVGRRLWIQTPARWFPMEPHLITPFVHYFSRGVQSRLLRWFTVWGWLNRPTATQIAGFLSEVRMLTLREMKKLFPDCEILRERLFGLTKSYIAIRL
ncbi:MAG TPA: methyltransferase domain-containing protein [Candidatus Limnocylindria bacterium]|nr:methyltransferase domain-containing protein [Candidatus Limnocylindria bacterium]